MNSSKSIETLYRIIYKLKGPIAAKQFISETLYGIIDDIQQEGLEVSEMSIDEKLSRIATDFLEASQKQTDVA